MKKSEIPQVLMNIQRCPLQGRKLTRYLCANVNVITEYIRNEEKIFIDYCTLRGIDMRKINEINQFLNPENNGGYAEKIAQLRENNQEKYEMFMKYEDIRLDYFDKPSDIKLIPIPERFLPNSITYQDRKLIEGLIKIPRI